MVRQIDLFGAGEPSLGRLDALVHRDLEDGAWLDYLPGFIKGHERLFEHLVAATHWHHDTMHIYDKTLPVPRLLAKLPDDVAIPPVLEAARELLGARYATDFVRMTMAYYRDGKDSVAWHGDRVARNMATSVMATISLGGPRRFLLRPKRGGPSIALELGRGDLLVMGGTIQRTWQHGVPKSARPQPPRIAVMLRPAWGSY
jgi:alkylated DNA repair dioxygenase AlkB